jgi:glycosyltransferase involved in cell wall biosynthesis
MKTLPTVSVIIPTYNYSHYICEAIDSILASSFPTDEVEIIIVDDGSTDDTKTKIAPYNDQVHYFYQQNLGKAAATQVAIEQSKGKYIFNLDADDLFLPEKIQTVVDIFESDPEITHIGHPAIFLDVEKDSQSIEDIPDFILGKKMWGKALLSQFYRRGILFGAGSTFAARSHALKKFSIPREVDMYIDEYMFLATVNQGHSFFVEKPLSIWRIHGKNFTYSDRSVYLQKMQRNLASVEAVQSQLTHLNIEEEIRRIYQLKALSLSLALKEQQHEKKWSDIVEIWSSVFANFSAFGLETFAIAKQYYVLNRTLPTPLLALLKQVSAQ